MINHLTTRKRSYLWILTVAILLLAWSLFSYSGLVGKSLIATPNEIWQTIQAAFSADAKKSERFHVHASYTILRALEGWGLSAVIGSSVGICIGLSSRLFSATELVIEFARAVPPVLALPLFLVAYNYGESAYTATIVFGCLPIMTIAVSKGVSGVRRAPFALLDTHGVSIFVKTLARCIEVLPSVFLGLRLTLSFAIIIAVVSEMVFSPRSGWALGSLARDAEIDFNTPLFYTCLLTIGLFGFMANLALRFLEAWLFGRALPDQ